MNAGPTLDAFLPEDIARKAEAIGVAKARRGGACLVALVYWLAYLRPRGPR